LCYNRQGTDSDTSRFSNTSVGGVGIRILQHARIPNKKMKEQSPDMNPYIIHTRIRTQDEHSRIRIRIPNPDSKT
jgi:hypothetical protein